jgi:hypothetical protein
MNAEVDGAGADEDSLGRDALFERLGDVADQEFLNLEPMGDRLN